jgi:MYXO-CTERM domain-containing protein
VIIDGTPVGTTTSDAAGNWTFTPTVPLADGPHDITATTTNNVGNISPPSNTVRIVVDTGVPDTTIVSGPSGNTESTSATFTFSSNEAGVTYECSLDGASYVTCSNPATFADLAEGEHTLLVRARDSAGNVDASPAMATWTVVRAVTDRDFLGDGIGCAASGGDPSSLAMMGLGLLAVLLARRRRQR